MPGYESLPGEGQLSAFDKGPPWISEALCQTNVFESTSLHRWGMQGLEGVTNQTLMNLLDYMPSSTVKRQEQLVSEFEGEVHWSSLSRGLSQGSAHACCLHCGWAVLVSTIRL